jgi:hypothetical protein
MPRSCNKEGPQAFLAGEYEPVITIWNDTNFEQATWIELERLKTVPFPQPMK